MKVEGSSRRKFEPLAQYPDPPRPDPSSVSFYASHAVWSQKRSEHQKSNLTFDVLILFKFLMFFLTFDVLIFDVLTLSCQSAV
jgi:hypothetical protein